VIALLAIVLAQTRIASDFELQQMQQQVARARDFPSQLSAHLNLGDLRQARNEPDLARADYRKALEIASNERAAAREAGDLTRYATATSYAALSEAKLCGTGTPADGGTDKSVCATCGTGTPAGGGTDKSVCATCGTGTPAGGGTDKSVCATCGTGTPAGGGTDKSVCATCGTGTPAGGGTDKSVCATGPFALAEEAMRYSSDSAKSWNLYATTMAALRLTAKAAGAARNAVALEKDPLDLAIYKYTLASSLGDSPEAAGLLIEVIQSLRSPQFDALRRQVARTESFEIYSSARGDVAAYVSTLNRAQLRLAALYERSGDLANAKQQYANVLADRSDDATALAAIARLEPSDEHFKAAFDANPFSLPLIRDYQMNLSLGRGRREAAGDGTTVGDKVRLAVEQMQRGEYPASIVTITIVEKQFPNNATLAALRRDIDEKRKAFLARFDNPAQLDQQKFTGTVVFDSGPPFETGTIDGQRFRFSQPANFNGSFKSAVPLRLAYRILGPTQIDGADALLVEPLKLEPPQ
jgi:tetratricopeptide (TPR) repeat protein